METPRVHSKFSYMGMVDEWKRLGLHLGGVWERWFSEGSMAKEELWKNTGFSKSVEDRDISLLPCVFPHLDYYTCYVCFLNFKPRHLAFGPDLL